MIGKITGRIDYRAPDHLLIDVRGVGYLVYCSDRTMAALPGVGEVVALFTDLVVREDLMQLFGFQTLAEKEWHRLLTSVQGVGAKASLAILGALGPDGVSRAIALGDWNAVKVAKGVGPKIAQRVVLDLKDKAPGVMAMTGSLAEAHGEVEAAAEGIETAAPKRRPEPVRAGRGAVGAWQPWLWSGRCGRGRGASRRRDARGRYAAADPRGVETACPQRIGCA